MKQRAWFEIKAAADGSAADIYVFGVIGDWMDDYFGTSGPDYGVTTAKSFVDALAALPESVKQVRVHINSSGGDAFNGVTIANVLRSEKQRGRKVTTIVEGLAASAASVVAMGGEKVQMADNALLMVHAPWTVAMGNARDMRAQADLLDQVRDSLAKTYQWHSPLSDKEILSLIEGEDGQGTWLDAPAALAAGLVTEVVSGAKASASIDPGDVARLRVPERFAAQVAAFVKAPEPVAVEPEPEPAAAVEPEPVVVEPEPEPVAAVEPEVVAAVVALPSVPAEPLADPAEVARVCAENKLSVEFTAATIAAQPTSEGLAARVAAEVERVAKDTERSEAIRAMFGKYNLGKVGEALARAGVDVAAAGAILTEWKAQRDSVTIDGTLPTSPLKQNVLSYSEIYGRLNGVK